MSAGDEKPPRLDFDEAEARALEEKYGAVFVWSMYLPFAGPQYIREAHGRPMDALASRICSINEVLHLPPWMNGWMVSEAERCGLDGRFSFVVFAQDHRVAKPDPRLFHIAAEAAGCAPAGLAPQRLTWAAQGQAPGWPTFTTTRPSAYIRFAASRTSSRTFASAASRSEPCS